MSQEKKKDKKAGRSGRKPANQRYLLSARRWVNKVRRVRGHVRRQPGDLAAARWLEGKDERRPQ